jgi:hypothetical protein
MRAGFRLATAWMGQGSLADKSIAWSSLRWGAGAVCLSSIAVGTVSAAIGLAAVIV